MAAQEPGGTSEAEQVLRTEESRRSKDTGGGGGRGSRSPGSGRRRHARGRKEPEEVEEAVDSKGRSSPGTRSSGPRKGHPWSPAEPGEEEEQSPRRGAGASSLLVKQGRGRGFRLRSAQSRHYRNLKKQLKLTAKIIAWRKDPEESQEGDQGVRQQEICRRGWIEKKKEPRRRGASSTRSEGVCQRSSGTN